jgi:hypothetical protein
VGRDARTIRFACWDMVVPPDGLGSIITASPVPEATLPVCLGPPMETEQAYRAMI